MKKQVLLYVLILVLLSSFVFGATLNVPGDYATIQATIDAASENDTINVSAGTYNEQITINKNGLVVKSINGAATTIINLGEPTETTGIWILANGTTFNGFTVGDISTVSGHAQYAIRVRGISNTISNNVIIGKPSRDWWTDEEDSAINLDGTSATTTANNIVENNEIYDFSAMGIQVVGSDGNYNAHDNIIRNNNIHDIDYYAIVIDRSANQRIEDNTLTDIGPTGHAADGYYSTGVVVWGSQAIGTKIINQDVSGIEVGIALSAAQGVTIENCKITNNDFIGIKLAGSSWLTDTVKDNIIQNNEITGNSEGIVIKDGTGSSLISTGNKINWNNIENNDINGVNNLATQEINAENNWWGSCKGPSGIGPGDGDAVSANVDYNPWLGICIEKKAEFPCAFETDNIKLSAKLSSELDIREVWFSIFINGINHNESYEDENNGNYSYTIPSSELVGSSSVIWNVYANDTYGNTYNNLWKTIYVRSRTAVSINPTTPDGLNGWYVTEPIFTLTRDPVGVKTYYRWNGNPALIYTAPFNLDDTPNPPKETAGTLELKYWSEFPVCGNESVLKTPLTIDLTKPKIKQIKPINNSEVPTTTPEIYAYIDEIYFGNSGVDEETIVLKIGGVNVTPVISIGESELDREISYIPAVPLGVGLHEIYVEAYDNAGNKGILSWNFNVSPLSIFSWNVFSPTTKTYNESKILLNVSTNRNSEIEYSINGGSFKTLCRDCTSYGKKKIFSEGVNQLIIMATDSAGNVVTKNFTLEIDTKAPKIYNTYPKKGSSIAGSEFTVKYKEENLKQTLLQLNKINKGEVINISVGCPSSKKSEECVKEVNLSDYNGELEYTFFLKDNFNTVASKSTLITVDSKKPTIAIHSPKPGNYSDNRILLNITIDEKVSKLEYSINKKSFRRLKSNTDSFAKIRTFKGGQNNLTIRVTDYVGHRVNKTVSFNVTED